MIIAEKHEVVSLVHPSVSGKWGGFTSGRVCRGENPGSRGLVLGKVTKNPLHDPPSSDDSGLVNWDFRHV